MPKDTPMPAPILDDLLALTRDAIAPAEAVLASATVRIRDAVSDGGNEDWMVAGEEQARGQSDQAGDSCACSPRA